MEDPKPQFSYIVEQIKKRHPNFAYLHLIEPRVAGNMDRSVQEGEVSRSYECIFHVHNTDSLL